MIAIIDYGMGNVKAFADVYKKLNIHAVIVRNVDDLAMANRVILPGVGAFDHAMQKLEQSGMRKLLDEIVLNRRMPVLGICVGMQMLAGSSEEGRLPGLGWIAGRVKRFQTVSFGRSIRIPHMGWSNMIPKQRNTLLNGLDSDARFYYLHSYYFECHDSEDVIAVNDYDGEFACVVNHGNIYGVQFHPEKSHQWGVQLLSNFATV